MRRFAHREIPGCPTTALLIDTAEYVGQSRYKCDQLSYLTSATIKYSENFANPTTWSKSLVCES